jgi:hypothetical protein
MFLDEAHGVFQLVGREALPTPPTLPPMRTLPTTCFQASGANE